MLTRIHSACLTGNVLFSTECECRIQLETAMRVIQLAGVGLVVHLPQEGRANGKTAHVASQSLKKGPERLGQSEAYERLGYPADARSYRAAAEIIRNLGITSIALMTDNDAKVAQLRAYSLKVLPRTMDDLIGRNGARRAGATPTIAPATLARASAVVHDRKGGEMDVA